MALFNLSKEQVEQIKRQRELADKSFFKRLRKRIGIAFAAIGLASGSAAVSELSKQQEKTKDAQAEEVKTNDYGEIGADEALKNMGIQIEEEMPVPGKTVDDRQDDNTKSRKRTLVRGDASDVLHYIKTDHEDLKKENTQEVADSTQEQSVVTEPQTVVQPTQPVQPSSEQQQQTPSQEQVVEPTTPEQPSSEDVQGVTLVSLSCVWNTKPADLNESNCVVKNGYVIDTSLFSVWATFSDGSTVLNPAGFEWFKGVDVTTEDGKPAWKYVPDMVKYKYGDVELTAGCEVPVFGKELGREEKDNLEEALDEDGGVVSEDVADDVQERVDEDIKKSEEKDEEIKNENDQNTSLDVDSEETPDTSEVPEEPSQDDSSSETPSEPETTTEEVITVDDSDEDFFGTEEESTQELQEEQTQAEETTQESQEEQTQVEETTQESQEEQTQATESIEGIEQVDLDYTAAAEAYQQAVEESKQETQTSNELGALADLVNSDEEMVEYTQGTTEYNDIIPGQEQQEQSEDMNR